MFVTLQACWIFLCREKTLGGGVMKGSIADGITIKVGHGIITIPRETPSPKVKGIIGNDSSKKTITRKPLPKNT
jgi:hypothetical protein